MTLFKELRFSRLEYCCVLTLPFTMGDIAGLESLERLFTLRTDTVKSLKNWERLKALGLQYLERRRGCYIWKILKGIFSI